MYKYNYILSLKWSHINASYYWFLRLTLPDLHSDRAKKVCEFQPYSGPFTVGDDKENMIYFRRVLMKRQYDSHVKTQMSIIATCYRKLASLPTSCIKYWTQLGPAMSHRSCYCWITCRTGQCREEMRVATWDNESLHFNDYYSKE